MEGVSYPGALSFREKKKNVERRIKVLEESAKSVPYRNQNSNWERLKNSQNRFQNAYRSGTSQEREESLLLLERAVAQITPQFAEEGKKLAQGLIVRYSEAYLHGKDHKEETVPDARREERAASYFRMAKEELALAEKFDRDRNDSYAIVLYGRSIRYSLSALETMGFETPDGYENVPVKKAKRL
ncbi:hypothetical protein EHQ12_02180 [Leptospira gomenensis]|uniref:Uncharacterized protein n=2 Tax=Leptospira gomenensis TaxID=2484974 RepID=A0A5F1YGL7_9LEPT|nr:hypothetical protein EHQ17_14075 [Leptospira gomenensis]TGK44221.1 hypothetical protein EHQ12_02180 [Leptospira gomenensis]TGK46257.1 hypothetical protein EHQ07_07310 [Leptospira gomenensis]TGK54781.1 hypothetical protein EHQ13_18900 [Leptospira gomenensis]